MVQHHGDLLHTVKQAEIPPQSLPVEALRHSHLICHLHGNYKVDTEQRHTVKMVAHF